VLRAGIRGTQENYASNQGDSVLGSALIVGPGKDTGNLVFRYYPMASISGKVLDDAGEPVEDAVVQLIRSSTVGGKRLTRIFRAVRTDDRGEYRLGWVPGGTGYYVAVTGEPWFNRNRFARPEPNGEEPAETRLAYATSYYPDTTDAAHAAPLNLAPGAEVHADFTLRTVPGARILVKHGAPPGSTGLVSLTYPGIDGVEAYQQQVSLTPSLSGVPPGRYTLRVTARSGDSDLIGFANVDVNGADVTVDMPLHPAASISGRLQFARAGTQPNGTVVVTITTDGVTGIYNTTVKSDGTFRFPNVLPGRYRVAIRSAGWFATKIDVAGAALREGLIDIGDGDSATVTITASDETGNVNGFVKEGDRTLPEVLVVLVSAGKDQRAVYYRAFQTESDGSFDFRSVPAGRYLMFAIEDKSFEYANPEALKPYLANALPVTIEPHKASVQDVALTAPKP
jgi:hypothetical protein